MPQQIPEGMEKLVDFYMYTASAKTLTSVYNLIAEIQTFQLDQMWPIDSPEYKATGDVLEAIKRLVAVKQNKLVAKSQQLLE